MGLIGAFGSGKAKRSAAAVTLIAAVTFDADPTAYNSAKQDVDSWRYFLLHLDVESDGTPTTIRFILQFSPDGGTTWHDYLQGPFASLYYEYSDVADGVTHCFSGVVHGRDMRLRAVAVGTDGSNTFTVTAKLETWR